MSKPSEGNEDWIKRQEVRIPSKGAAAAERASAGLGTSSDDDAGFIAVESPRLTVWGKPTPKKKPETGKQL